MKLSILVKALPLLLLSATSALANSYNLPAILVRENLIRLQQDETEGRTAAEVEQMNRNSFRTLPNRIPEATVHGSDIVNLINSYNYHPIIGPKVASDYDQTGVSIGYCFGRAYYFHKALLKLGVSDDAIMKAWIVGKIGKNWQFHVATMVRGQDGDWWVMDTVSDSWARGVRVKDWYLAWKAESSPTTRIYFTRPEKFTPALGAYDPVQLGYGLDRDKDWYKNYFVDLDFWLNSRGALPFFRKMGLDPVGPEQYSNSGNGGLW